MIKISKVIAIDILLILCTIILYQFISFLLGYSSSDNHKQAATFLLGAFIIINFLVNFFVNRGLSTGRNVLIISSIFILIVYTALLILSPL